ncbi:uncharacterized protein LOC120997308 [Bufo bufo]|uniref:uncharacterized protein LOC120997308 n=1 Tax=Bufo bufo TaxID=8384 RepID=UPI001ABDB690|nr:uncharacterized protein LOC120997308 [Bufo bufo]XP_040283277.1 uncharacterized protein LOC120997308 [Bufo bufo]XP_040283278.1 uncharacterized protein LOC120997308 [Bufo bufo]XP_040283279.1 uncharacterized protein LOC120997308 [Bufo bufo]
MPSCIIKGCTHTWRDKGKNMIMHVFPKDRGIVRKWIEQAPDRFPNVEEWVEKIMDSKKTHDNYRLCSKHFDFFAYEEGGLRKKLRPDAVPTIFPKKLDSTQDSSDATAGTAKESQSTSESFMSSDLRSASGETQAAAVTVPTLSTTPSVRRRPKKKVANVPTTQVRSDAVISTGNVILMGEMNLLGNTIQLDLPLTATVTDMDVQIASLSQPSKEDKSNNTDLYWSKDHNTFVLDTSFVKRVNIGIQTTKIKHRQRGTQCRLLADPVKIGKAPVSRERPALWHTRAEVYHDRIRKGRAWKEISKELLPTAWNSASVSKKEKIIQQIKKRWNTCRNQFRRELNTKCKSGVWGKKKPYMYTRHLQFLKPIMDLRRTVDNLSDNSNSQAPSCELDDRPGLSSDTQVKIEQPEVMGESSVSSVSLLHQPLQERSEIREEVQDNNPEVVQANPEPSQQQRAAPVSHSSGRRGRRVMEYLNRNRSDAKEETALKGLAPSLCRVPEERQTRCLSALAMVIDEFTGPAEPHEVLHFLEKSRDKRLNVITPYSRLNRPDTPILHTPGPYSRELFEL